MANNSRSGISASHLIDVSFAGSTIRITGNGSVEISNFMDNSNPIDFPDTAVSDVAINCYGQMIRNAKPNPIVMSVTVIPGSKEDNSLYNMWQRYRLTDGSYDEQWRTALRATISVANKTMAKKTYEFSGGTMVSGPGGPSATGDGKMQGRTYTFAFAKTE